MIRLKGSGGRPAVLGKIAPGFSLIEVLAALLILVAALLPILTVFAFCSKLNLYAGRQIQALYYAAEVLEEIQANPADYELPPAGASVYDTGGLSSLGILGNPPAGFNPEVIVDGKNQPPGLYRITVTVNVQWRTRQPSSVSLTSLIYVGPD